MPTTQLHQQASAVRADLSRLESSLKALLTTVGGSIGSAVNSRVAAPLETLAGHLEPLLNLLGAGGTPTPAPLRRGPGRPRKDASAAPVAAPTAPKKKRRGGRGRKANLTAEAIQAALKQSNGNKSAAARALGVSQPTFYKYLGAAKASTDGGKAGKPAKAKKGGRKAK